MRSTSTTGCATRPASDERVCRELCAKLRIDLHVERPTLGRRATSRPRPARPATRRPSACAPEPGPPLVVTGHTRTDLAETVLYRLAVSPGARGAARPAAAQRPSGAPAAGLRSRRARASWRSPPACRSPTTSRTTTCGFARNRIRAEVLPVLRELSPAAERNIAETRAELAEEATLLERVVLEALDELGPRRAPSSIGAEALARAASPALRRLCAPSARRAGGRAAGGAGPGARRRDHARRRLARGRRGRPRRRPARRLRERDDPLRHVLRGRGGARSRSALRLPGRARLGRWEVRAELHPGPGRAAGPGPGDARRRRARAGRSRCAPGARATACARSAWRARRRSRTSSPTAGCRARRRHGVPVVTVGGEVAWVAGVAVSERFRLGAATEEVVVLSARALGPATPACARGARPAIGEILVPTEDLQRRVRSSARRSAATTRAATW